MCINAGVFNNQQLLAFSSVGYSIEHYDVTHVSKSKPVVLPVSVKSQSGGGSGEERGLSLSSKVKGICSTVKKGVVHVLDGVIAETETCSKSDANPVERKPQFQNAIFKR